MLLIAAATTAATSTHAALIVGRASQSVGGRSFEPFPPIHLQSRRRAGLSLCACGRGFCVHRQKGRPTAHNTQLRPRHSTAALHTQLLLQVGSSLVMCRLTAYTGPALLPADLVTRPNRSIITQSFCGKAREAQVARPPAAPLIPSTHSTLALLHPSAMPLADNGAATLQPASE